MTTLQIIVTVVGMAMSFAYFPQAYRIFKNKSADDISLEAYAIFAIGTLIWAIYGFVVHDLVIIGGYSIGVIGSWLVFLLTIYYRFLKRK